MRTYGKVTLEGDEWVLELEPQVALRAKHIFQGIRRGRSRRLRLSATDENSRDLEWFIGRYPLEVAGRGELERRARRHEEVQEDIWKILEGDYECGGIEMELEPRGYQVQAARLCQRAGGLLLADDLGLGKTVSAITLLSLGGNLPALVVVPTHLQIHWRDQLRKFLPGLSVHILKKGTPYEIGSPDVIITTYYKLCGWVGTLVGKIRTIIFDEVQELRRVGSNKYDSAHVLARSGDLRIMGLSATPIYNYGVEFWNVIDILRPGILGSREEFVREWCTGYQFEKMKIHDPRAFGAYLREEGILLRRTKKEVGRELPPVVRVVETVESDRKIFSDAKDGAMELAKILLDGDREAKERFTAAGQFDAKMRQITGLAKAPYVAEFVRMLIEGGSGPVVLFGWHRDVYGIWEERLAEYSPVRFTGGESVKQKQDNLEKFLRGESQVLMMSLRSGSGVDGLQEVSSTVVIGELDWSPGALEQCIGRVSRDGQKESVFVYYLTATDGADPVMVDVLGIKRGQIEGVRDPNAPLMEMGRVDPDHIKKLAEAYVKGKTR